MEEDYDDYRYTPDGKIRRRNISSHLVIDKLYDRAANYDEYVNGVRWEDINHVNEELLWYESMFNKAIKSDKVEHSGVIHVNPSNYLNIGEEIYNEDCGCTRCLIKSRFPSWYRHYKIVEQDKIFYIDVDEKLLPVSNFIKTIC